MRPNITFTLRGVAELIDDAVRYGLPAPHTVHVNGDRDPDLIMSGDDFTEVEAWGDYLETPVEHWTRGDREHIDTRADVSDVYGITVRVTTNRPVTVTAPA